ncbi:MAG TPA: hypothetical protein DEB39_15640 [Planctomycetaceae bacterium]|nr:hypothetical protein [Planctomycetaceae bacterium]
MEFPEADSREACFPKVNRRIQQKLPADFGVTRLAKRRGRRFSLHSIFNLTTPEKWFYRIVTLSLLGSLTLIGCTVQNDGSHAVTEQEAGAVEAGAVEAGVVQDGVAQDVVPAAENTAPIRTRPDISPLRRPPFLYEAPITDSIGTAQQDVEQAGTANADTVDVIVEEEPGNTTDTPFRTSVDPQGQQPERQLSDPPSGKPVYSPPTTGGGFDRFALPSSTPSTAPSAEPSSVPSHAVSPSVAPTDRESNGGWPIPGSPVLGTIADDPPIPGSGSFTQVLPTPLPNVTFAGDSEQAKEPPKVGDPSAAVPEQFRQTPQTVQMPQNATVPFAIVPVLVMKNGCGHCANQTQLVPYILIPPGAPQQAFLWNMLMQPPPVPANIAPTIPAIPPIVSVPGIPPRYQPQRRVFSRYLCGRNNSGRDDSAREGAGQKAMVPVNIIRITSVPLPPTVTAVPPRVYFGY